MIHVDKNDHRNEFELTYSPCPHKGSIELHEHG